MAQTPGGGCCTLSRRSFWAQCAACAGAIGLTALKPRLVAAESDRKLRIRIAFSHPTPDRITWPNIGYDYQRRANQVLAQLRPLCPDIEFLPAHVVTNEDADKVFAEDKQADGYLVYVLGAGGAGGTLVAAAGKAGRPIVMVEDHYAGPFSLGFNGRAAQAGWKAIGLATSRMEDVAAVVNCFKTLRKPGATADQFLAEAQAAFRKNIARMGDMACAEDKVRVNPVGQVIEKLRGSIIVLVGRDPGPAAKAIEQEFGAKVVSIGHPELHDAWSKADPAAAEKWAEQWTGGAERVIEPAREDIVKSGAMHVAMQQVMRKYNAQAISINCLGGFYGGHLKAYPCLGFVELNNSGLVGACEGDLASTVTMLAVGYLCERPGFISDPVIDTATNQIIYAHCVAPTKVFGPQGGANPYHIRSHSEDRRGAAVRSLMPLGYMTTTLKFMPGQRLAVLHQGKTVANVDDDRACRTKLAAELKGDIEKLFRDWAYGWHRVTFYGDLKAPLGELCDALKLTMVEEA